MLTTTTTTTNHYSIASQTVFFRLIDAGPLVGVGSMLGPSYFQA